MSDLTITQPVDGLTGPVVLKSSGDPVHLWRVESVDTAIAVARGRADGTLTGNVYDKNGACNAVMRQEPAYNSFYGASASKALELATGGWKDGENILQTATDAAHTHLAQLQGAETGMGSADLSALPDLVPSVAPSARWDLGDYMTGAPDLYREQVPPPSRVVHFVLPSGIVVDVTPDQLFNAAGALVAILTRYQQAGVSVALSLLAGANQIGCASSARRNGASVATLLPVVEVGRAMELDRVAFWVAHPSGHRRFGFSLREMVCHRIDDVGGYGRSYRAGGAELRAVTEYLRQTDPTAVVLPPLMDCCAAAGDSAALCAKWWTDRINQLAAEQGGAA